jgi:hypothetical protein
VCRCGFLAFLIVFSGCTAEPDWYAPPLQRQRLEAAPAPKFKSYVAMNDPHASRYLVKDISGSLESGVWRWGFRRPELQLYVEDVTDQKLVVNFSVAGATLRETGPFSVSFYVNGKLLGRESYSTEGQQRFEKPVPPEMLKAGVMNRIVIEPSKVWVAPDGVALGLILTEAGFQR